MLSMIELLLRGRRKLLAHALGAVAVALLLKSVAHAIGWEVISLNPLFSGIVAANVFLMGFLLNGVVTDYKESERLPGELASCLDAIADEAAVVWEAKRAEPARDCLERLLALATSIRRWFDKQEPTRSVMEQVTRLSAVFARFEPLTQANFIARLKQEQSQVRRLLVRIHSIRETSFIPSAYVVAEITSLLVFLGLILARIDPFYESMFFVGVITFLLRFLGLLIRDLDNPFGYYEGQSTEDVSLKPLDDTVQRLRRLVAAMATPEPAGARGDLPAMPIAQ